MWSSNCDGLSRTVVFVGKNNERHAMMVSVDETKLKSLLKDLKEKVKTQIDETSDVLRSFEVVAVHFLNGHVLNRESTRREDLKKLSLSALTEYRES